MKTSQGGREFEKLNRPILILRDPLPAAPDARRRCRMPRVGRGARVMSPRGSRWAPLAALVAFLAIVAPHALRAQDTGWVLQGEGGLVTALVLDPTDPEILYATTARGIFKTINGGATWRPQGGVLDGKSILAMAIDP